MEDRNYEGLGSFNSWDVAYFLCRNCPDLRLARHVASVDLRFVRVALYQYGLAETYLNSPSVRFSGPLVAEGCQINYSTDSL